MLKFNTRNKKIETAIVGFISPERVHKYPAFFAFISLFVWTFFKSSSTSNLIHSSSKHIINTKTKDHRG